MTRKTRALTLCSAMMLASCSLMPDWLGEPPAPKVEGERISVFKLESTLKPNHALEDVPVTLPAVGSFEHKELAADLTHSSRFSVGDGASYGLLAVPVVVDNVIYTLDARGKVSAHETGKGNKELWHHNVVKHKGKRKDFAGGGIAVMGEQLFVATGSDEIVALDRKEGKERWRKPLGNVVRATPLAISGGVFVITIDNHLYAIDARDGHVVWTHAGAVENIGVFGAASPVAAPRVLVAPYSSGEIYGLHPATGEEVWVGNLGYSALESSGTVLNDIDITPVVSGNVMYAAGNAGILYAVDADSSRRIWHQELSSVRGIWPAGDFIYVTAGANEVACLQAATGEVKWVVSLPRYKDADAKKGTILLSGPVLAGEQLLVPASNGVLFVLSPYDGTIKKQVNIPEGVTQPPVVEGGKIYLLSDAAIVTVIE